MSTVLNVVRPATLADVDGLLALARVAGVGLTTLPADRGLLAAHVRASVRAFELAVEQPAGERYLFVLEDPLTGQVLGTAGAVARVGGFEPFYSYAVAANRLHSEALGVDRTVRHLQLQARHQGPSEIGTLFLHPSARGGGNGRLLSLARFAFMAAFPHRFAQEVIAEMRGVLDAEGHSPFWEAVGRHFFAMPFAEADARSAADKGFIADLMPKHPIYLDMLPPKVQAVVGAVHAETRPALKLLEDEGFEFAEQVDIFDAGPMLVAVRAAVRAVAESRVLPLVAVQPTPIEGVPMLVSNERLDFRCGLGAVQIVQERPLDVEVAGGVEGALTIAPASRSGAGLVLARDLALALQVRLGDPVRFVPARRAGPASSRRG